MSSDLNLIENACCELYITVTSIVKKDYKKLEGVVKDELKNIPQLDLSNFIMNYRKLLMEVITIKCQAANY